jgi:Protein of unknown function (DUF3108)
MAVALTTPTLHAADFRTLRALAARRWWVALAVSLLVHAFILSSPGWRLPTLDELLPSEEHIDARLLPPPQPAAPALPPSPPAAAAEPAPPPRPKASRSPRAVPPVPTFPATPVPQPEAAAAAAPAAAPPAMAPAPPAASSALPKRARIRFGIAMGGRGFIVGRAEHRWTLEGASYTLRATAETTGLAALFKPAVVTQISEGEVLADGLRPNAFRVERGGATGDNATFDWAGGRVAMSPGPRDSAAEPGMQDMLSLFWQLGMLPVSATGMAVTVATGKKIERYVFALAGEEKISTALGERTAIHLKTLGTSGGDATEIWIDVAKRVPLRIRHVDRKGETFDQTVEEMEIE